VESKPSLRPAVEKLLESEAMDGVDGLAYHKNFARRVDVIKESLVGLVQGLKSEGKSIAANMAAGKGRTLTNYAAIGLDLIDSLVDRNTHIQSKYMPRKHLPIYSPLMILENMRDYVLLFSCNFTDEILRQQEAYTVLRGRFIRPIPSPRVILPQERGFPSSGSRSCPFLDEICVTHHEQSHGGLVRAIGGM